MGKLDQFVKRLFTEETPRATHDALSFSVPPQTPTPAIEADGVLLLKNPASLPSLPYPWRLAAQGQVTFGFQSEIMPAGFGFQIQAWATYQFSTGLMTVSFTP